MSHRAFSVQSRRAVVLITFAGTFAAPAYAQPTVVEPGWKLTREIAFSKPWAAHYNPFDGKIYVGSREGASPKGLYRIEPNDAATPLWTGDWVAGVLIDPNDGDIFTTDDYSGEIFRFPFGGGSRQPWVAGLHGGDDDPIGMAVAPRDYTGGVVQPGQALVVDRGYSGADEVWGWRTTAPEGEWPVHSDNGTLEDPVDIAIGREHVYLVDRRQVGRIYRVEPGGALTPVDTSPTVLAYAQGIAIDPQTQDLFVLTSGDPRVARVRVSGEPPTGVVSDMFTGFASGYCWAGIDVTPDGSQIIVTNNAAARIYVFTRQPAIVMRWHTIHNTWLAFVPGRASIQLAATAGQPESAAPLTAGDITLAGGFWSGVELPCPGDLDGDADVDLDDLTLLLQNFASGPGGDVDGDGDTDLDDLTLLLQNFGSACA